MQALRWILPALVPALCALALVFFSDKRREPWPVVLGTFALGSVFALGAFFLQDRAAQWTGLDLRADVAGNQGALVFVFAFVAPVREAAKVAAMWPAFRSKHFDEPLDGVVYSSAAALGFAVIENGRMLMHHPAGGIWYARAALALPAHVFFACTWGYALGRVKRVKTPGPIFPAAWIVATLAHGLYAHLIHGRGSGAIVGVVPLLLAMGAVAAFAARDLRRRGDANERDSVLLERVSIDFISAPPSLRTVREAMKREGRPITIRWIVFGSFVTFGAMVAGLAAAVAFGHWAHVDFSIVNERDVSTTGPVALLGAGLLAAFPVSGYFIARASALPSLLEPALAAAAAILFALVLLGLTAPIALVFALAFSPIAFGLSCAGAWVGRPNKG